MSVSLFGYFTVPELVDPDTYAAEGDDSVARLDEGLLRTLVAIREMTGLPVKINNWHSNGTFRYRGFRPAGCGVGHPGGFHYLGRAADFDIGNWPADVSRAWIIRNQESLPWIRRLEANVDWVHMDNGPHSEKSIYLFKA